MVRRGAIVMLGAFVVLFLVVASWPIFAYEKNDFYSGLTGNSIREAVGNFYETSSLSKRIFILAQVILLMVIVVAAIIVLSRFRSKEKISKASFMTKGSVLRSRTDLDILYEMLKVKKEIGMESIEEAFKVSPEIAIEWSKILENGDLAEIDYPRFGKPILRLADNAPVRSKNEAQETINNTKKKIVKKKIGVKVQKKVLKKHLSSKKGKRKVSSAKGKKKVVKKKVVKKSSKRKKMSSKKR